jgi:hypothetical protein
VQDRLRREQRRAVRMQYALFISIVALSSVFGLRSSEIAVTAIAHECASPRLGDRPAVLGGPRLQEAHQGKNFARHEAACILVRARPPEVFEKGQDRRCWQVEGLGVALDQLQRRLLGATLDLAEVGA